MQNPTPSSCHLLHTSASMRPGCHHRQKGIDWCLYLKTIPLQPSPSNSLPCGDSHSPFIIQHSSIQSSIARIVPPLVSENNSPRPTSSIIHYPQTIRSSVCPPKNNYLQNPLHPFPPFSTLHSPFSIHQSTILTSSSRSSPVLALFQGSFLRNDYRLCSSTSGKFGTSGTSNISESSFPRKRRLILPRFLKTTSLPIINLQFKYSSLHRT